jgi:hypothetical protein
VNNIQYLNNFDANNNKTNEVEQTWVSAAWANTTQSYFTYDVNNNNTSELDQTWSNFSWIVTSYTTYLFDVNNLELASTQRNFDSTGTIITFGDSSYYYFHDVLGVNNINAENTNIKVYPDPNMGQFTIAGLQQGMIIEMYDYTGRKLNTQYTIDPENSGTINIYDQPNGVYLIRILDKDGTLVNQKKVVKAQ